MKSFVGFRIYNILFHQASAEPDVRPMHYRGCYRAFGDEPRVITEPLIMGCLSECTRAGYLFFAVMVIFWFNLCNSNIDLKV